MLSMHLWEVGHDPGALSFVVSRELNDQYLYSLEDFNPIYRGQHALVHPGLLLNMSNITKSPGFYLEPGIGGIHSRDVTRLRTSALVGDEFTVTWLVTEIFEKRGRTYQEKHSEVINSDGAVCLERTTYVTFVSRDTPTKGGDRDD